MYSVEEIKMSITAATIVYKIQTTATRHEQRVGQTQGRACKQTMADIISLCTDKIAAVHPISALFFLGYNYLSVSHTEILTVALDFVYAEVALCIASCT